MEFITGGRKDNHALYYSVQFTIHSHRGIMKRVEWWVVFDRFQLHRRSWREWPCTLKIAMKKINFVWETHEDFCRNLNNCSGYTSL